MARARDHEGNRSKLLRGAQACLSERGYAQTTARDLVAASGANLASIGYHFGGKEDLLNQAVAENTRAWMRSIERDLRAEEPATVAELLQRILAITVGRFAELEPYLRAFVEAFPPAVRSSALRVEMAAAYGEVRAAGQALLEETLGASGPAAQANAGVISSTLIALCDGFILQWLLDPEATPDVAQILRGLGALADAGGFAEAGSVSA